jgi:hypothetical protein
MSTMWKIKLQNIIFLTSSSILFINEITQCLYTHILPVQREPLKILKRNKSPKVKLLQILNNKLYCTHHFLSKKTSAPLHGTFCVSLVSFFQEAAQLCNTAMNLCRSNFMARCTELVGVSAGQMKCLCYFMLRN